MHDTTLQPHSGAHWAICRQRSDGSWIYLIERTPIFKAEDATVALRMVGLSPSHHLLAQFFPYDHSKRRCPTFEFMQLWYALDPTRPTRPPTTV